MEKTLRAPDLCLWAVAEAAPGGTRISGDLAALAASRLDERGGQCREGASVSLVVCISKISMSERNSSSAMLRHEGLRKREKVLTQRLNGCRAIQLDSPQSSTSQALGRRSDNRRQHGHASVVPRYARLSRFGREAGTQTPGRAWNGE